MIHEIYPEVFDNQYKNKLPQPDSTVFLIRKNQILLGEKAGRVTFPACKDLDPAVPIRYLFSISGQDYFLAEEYQKTPEEGKALADRLQMQWIPVMLLRDKQPSYLAMAGMTALHLANWYRSVQYCGCCGNKAVHDEKERMMRCPVCGNMMFPKINPAIVVAVTDGERLLLTRYAGNSNPNSYALVAGFVEIGETAEECVARELLEETGIHAKNIRYYGSQPWGFAGNLMMGYTAELDGSDEITLDQQELSTAVWLRPEEIPDIPDYSSLTREMIRRFKKGLL